MKTQYFLMLSGSYHDQTKRLLSLLNLGKFSSFSLVTHLPADYIDITSQRRTAHKASHVISAQPGISFGMEGLFEVESAYWYALNYAQYRNTPSA